MAPEAWPSPLSRGPRVDKCIRGSTRRSAAAAIRTHAETRTQSGQESADKRSVVMYTPARALGQRRCRRTTPGPASASITGRRYPLSPDTSRVWEKSALFLSPAVDYWPRRAVVAECAVLASFSPAATAKRSRRQCARAALQGIVRWAWKERAARMATGSLCGRRKLSSAVYQRRTSAHRVNPVPTGAALGQDSKEHWPSCLSSASTPAEWRAGISCRRDQVRRLHFRMTQRHRHLHRVWRNVRRSAENKCYPREEKGRIKRQRATR